MIVFYNQPLLYLAMTATKSIGHKIARIRELKGMNQEALADKLGVTQQAISKMEQSDHIDDLMIERISKALGVTPTAVRNFNEEALFNNIQTNSDTAANNTIVNYQFNPIEKIVELYDALLKSEREKIVLLEKVIEKLEK